MLLIVRNTWKAIRLYHHANQIIALQLCRPRLFSCLCGYWVVDVANLVDLQLFILILVLVFLNFGCWLSVDSFYFNALLLICFCCHLFEDQRFTAAPTTLRLPAKAVLCLQRGLGCEKQPRLVRSSPGPRRKVQRRRTLGEAPPRCAGTSSALGAPDRFCSWHGRWPLRPVAAAPPHGGRATLPSAGAWRLS